MTPGEWVWVTELQQTCQIIETQTLWDNTFYRVFPTQMLNLLIDGLKTRGRSGSSKPNL